MRDVAAAYEITGADFFRIRAYRNAADAVEQASIELKDVWDRGKLQSIPGIGANIAQHLDELFKKGKSRHFETVLKKLPQSVYKLLLLPGVGPKTAAKLVHELKLSNPKTAIDDLIKAASKGKIAELEGFGEKSQQELIEAVERYSREQSKEKRMLLPYADKIAQKAIKYMQKCAAVEAIEPLGSLRRMAATVGDVDLAVSTTKPKAVIAHFKKWDEAKKLLAAGENTARLIHASGTQIDIKTQQPEAFGALLQHFTGSKEHNIALREYAQKKGWSLSEHGIKKQKTEDGGRRTEKYATEEKFYSALGMQWIPPELRENRGEIETAIAKKIPKLIENNDIKSDLQIHSSFAIQPSHDAGEDSFAAILDKALELNYEYIAFTEHNPANKLTNKDKYSLIKARNKEIDKIISSKQKYTKIRAFKLLEVDILADGKLPINSESIDLLEGMLVSLHSSFRQAEDKMTERILKGLSHPKAKIFAHPTGRLLLKREGVEADWEKIFKYCAAKNKALEINAYPDRLDLPDTMVREAKKHGCKFVIGTDSHNVELLDNMKYGVAVARRGWLTKSDVLNTMPVEKFEKWLKDRR